MSQAHPTLLCTLIITIIIVVNPGACTISTFREGDVAELSFHYQNLIDFSVKIGRAKIKPFYDSESIIWDGVTKDPTTRLRVQEDHVGEIPNHQYLIRVIIKNVSRDDTGTYFCHIYNGDIMISNQTKKIGLVVRYFPGKAKCRVGTPGESNSPWTSLDCTASIGTIQGLFYCYQNGEKLPTKGVLNLDTKTIQQEFWMKREHTVFCCTSTFEKQREYCECTDFTWSPKYGSNYKLTILPCSDISVTTSERSTVSLSSNKPEKQDSSESSNIREAKNTPVNNQQETIWISYLSLIVIFALVLLGAIICLRLRLQQENIVGKNAIELQQVSTDFNQPFLGQESITKETHRKRKDSDREEEAQSDTDSEGDFLQEKGPVKQIVTGIFASENIPSHKIARNKKKFTQKRMIDGQPESNAREKIQTSKLINW